MQRLRHEGVKTTVFFDKRLLEEIDHYNPFPTRKEFLGEACRGYLKALKRKMIDEELALACAEASEEDIAANEEWEAITLETWK